MNRFFTIIFCTVALAAFAQTDSVSLGAGATDMVFYSFADGVQGTAANNDWHIAFADRYIAGFTYTSTSQAAAILINEAYGLKLYRSPTQKLSQWAAFDTTGYEGWQRMHNPDTTWTIGAFNINRNINDQFNYGWGEYNQGNHNIYSDSSIYLIVLPDGSYKKFAILSLLYDTTFYVQFGNLDNSNFATASILKSNAKNFKYLNIGTNTLMDKEPVLSSWDFVALRYNNTTYDSTNLNQDIGILTKDADETYAASGADAQQPCYSGSDYSNDINIIGHSWMVNDTTIPGLAYYVTGPTGSYKLVITGFGGAATGVVDFTVGICATQAGISQIGPDMTVSIYPLPATDHINVTVSSYADNNTTIKLLDMSGRLILSQHINTNSGENSTTLNVVSIQSGSYILSVANGTGQVNKMITIVR
jgi:hypothetical protein